MQAHRQVLAVTHGTVGLVIIDYDITPDLGFVFTVARATNS